MITPFKIVGTIVGLVLVYVVYFWKIERIVMERVTHKAMDSKVFLYSILS